MRKRGKPVFPGGIHPTDGYDKGLSMERAIQPYWPETVTLLAEQTPGGTCRLLVQPGEHVREGQLIGQPEAFMAAPLHASVSGTILSVGEVENQGRNVLACTIRREEEPCGMDAPYTRETAEISSLSREAILAGLKDGGLTGMGGAGFPTHKKYETDKPIDSLLINGAECEPFLTCDYRLMLEEGWALVNGVRLLLKGCGAKQAYICLEDNKPAAARNLEEILRQAKEAGAGEQVSVKILPTRYPQGGERQLIQAALGREVPAGGLPADVGVIVSNAATAKAAADMVLGKRPLTRRIVTVTGHVKNPGNYLVPIGTSARELIQLCGGVTAEKNRIIAGGPMTGPCAASDWNGETELFYITKNSSGIVVLPETHFQEQPCIRCRSCETVCPAGLIPYQIEFAFLDGDYDLCQRLSASECIACGCCSFTCPARRELSLHTRMARDMVKQRMRERAVKQA